MIKKRILSDIVNKDYYKHYLKSVKSPISEKVYMSVIDSYNTEVQKLVLDGYKVFFYPGLSSFSIQERKRVFRVNSVGDPILPVSWSLTKMNNQYDENGKLIRHYLVNDDYYYKVAWYKYISSEMIAYKFIPCRAFKKGIYERITTDPLIRLKYRSNTTVKPT